MPPLVPLVFLSFSLLLHATEAFAVVVLPEAAVAPTRTRTTAASASTATATTTATAQRLLLSHQLPLLPSSSSSFSCFSSSSGSSSRATAQRRHVGRRRLLPLYAVTDDEDEDDDDDEENQSERKNEKDKEGTDDDAAAASPAETASGNSGSGNPYADPNYPDLEFINYSDPAYSVDQGVSDEFWEGGDPATSGGSASKDDDEQQQQQDGGGGSATDSSRTAATSTSTTTEDEIEEMREERRRRNDEYQFQTYYAEILKNGDEYKGEWTVYKTSTFLDDPTAAAADDGDTSAPRLIKAAEPLKVISRGYKRTVPTDSDRAVDGERIVHEERVVPDAAAAVEDDPDYRSWQEDLDIDSGFGRHPEESSLSSSSASSAAENHTSSSSSSASTSGGGSSSLSSSESAARRRVENEIMSNAYWPAQLSPSDFRGNQGIMVCGNGYTVSTAVPLVAATAAEQQEKSQLLSGPFSQYMAEVGIQSKQVRFRIKFAYSVKDDEARTYHQQKGGSSAPVPALHLKSMTVCREALEMWPRAESSTGNTSGRNKRRYRSVLGRTVREALFGSEGADGGLYDPPPVGSEARAGRYMLLDLPGRATALFPYRLDQDDQDDDAASAAGWVFSLDWTPDRMRYQVDRKVRGGAELLGLRTLELSEVQSSDAETYRPRDGGADMRQ